METTRYAYIFVVNLNEEFLRIR